MGTKKKTPAQIRWDKRKAKVNKARRAKRKAVRMAAAKATLASDPTTLTNKQIVAAVKTVRKSRAKPVARLKTIARKAHKKGKRVVLTVGSNGQGASGGGNSGDAAMVATHENGKWTVESMKQAEFEQSRPNVIKVRALLTTARGKLGVEGAARDLGGIIENAKIEGHQDAHKAADARVRALRSMLDDRIVCAFIARMQAMEASSSNGIPEAVILSGLDVVKIMDALRSAGYSARGRHTNATDTVKDESPMLGRIHGSAVREAS